MDDVVRRVRAELEANVDAHTKETAQRFFKEEIKVYGIKTAAVTKIAKKYFAEIKDKSKDEVFRLCEVLFASGFMEESFVACSWAYGVRARFEEKDVLTFENWIKKYVTNWASCDTFCNHTVGAFIEKYPKHVADLREWAESDNRWMRRAAAVSLIIPARKGMFLEEAFGISDLLMADGEDLVQKGYGWLLKEASKVHQKMVFDYVVRNRKKMPRTALRYAIEKMPEELRKEAMRR